MDTMKVKDGEEECEWATGEMAGIKFVNRCHSRHCVMGMVLYYIFGK